MMVFLMFVKLKFRILARNMNRSFLIQKKTTDVQSSIPISHKEFIWIFILQMNESGS